MTATATTTIPGVSLLTKGNSREKKRGGDVFELGLSQSGIEVRRPGRPVQQMSWDRVSEWEIEERKGFVLLTLRGRGATTPLVVPGWTLDDLELLLRDVTADATTYEPNGPGPVVGDGRDAAPAAPAVPTPAPPTTAKPRQPMRAPEPATAPATATSATPSRAERRRRTADEQRQPRQFRVPPWKAFVTVALLGVLATAVTLVLLQSAGIIDWGFLGPVA